MSRVQWIFLITVSLTWLILAPLAFVTVYSALDLQASAKLVSEKEPALSNAYLSTLRTAALARRLELAESQKEARQELVARRDRALIDLFEARDRIRVTAMQVLTDHEYDYPQAFCIADDTKLTECQIEKKLGSCQADWAKIQQCSGAAAQMLKKDGATGKQLLQRLRDDGTAARRLGFDFNRLSARVRENQLLVDDPLYPQAEGLKSIRLPLFRSVFALPNGVLVACFTMLVATIAAAVASLVEMTIDSNPQLLSVGRVTKAFIAAPLIGGLAGFMVYFVVVAGTAFVTQSDGGQSIPSQNLSTPALASLGVFAGLAANSAIAWIKGKADSFFK